MAMQPLAYTCDISGGGGLKQQTTTNGGEPSQDMKALGSLPRNSVAAYLCRAERYWHHEPALQSSLVNAMESLWSSATQAFTAIN